MKNLSLFLFALLILGCGTEKPVVEELEPVIEEPEPVVMEDEPIGHPLVADGTVRHGQINVDPAPLNRHGFRFEFTKPFYRYWAHIWEKDGEYLGAWHSPHALEWKKTDILFIGNWSDRDLLEYDTEYEILIFAENHDCDQTEIVIQFRTKPQRPVVWQPEPVIQERIPAGTLGERFRFDPDEPQLVNADVRWGEKDVDPEPLNANGIHFELDSDLKQYQIDLRINGGASLNWAPHDLVAGDNLGRHIHIMPVEGSTLLEFDTNYAITIVVHDIVCWPMGWEIQFRTKPKP